MFSLTGKEPGLLGRWSFDDLDQPAETNASAFNTRAAMDKTPFGNDLVFAACTPNAEPFCRAGDGACNAALPPRRDCYSSPPYDSLMSNAAKPIIVRSSAPIGGNFMQAITLQNTPVAVSLSGTDLDGEQVQFMISTPPQRGFLRFSNGSTVTAGVLFRESTIWFVPDELDGGQAYAFFEFRVSDGLELSQRTQTVTLFVQCRSTELQLRRLIS